MGFDFVIDAVLTVLVGVSASKEHKTGLFQESFKNKNAIRVALFTAKSNSCHYSDTKNNLTVCSVLPWDALRFSLRNYMSSLLLNFVFVLPFMFRKSNAEDKTVSEEEHLLEHLFISQTGKNITYMTFNPLLSCVSNHSPASLSGSQLWAVVFRAVCTLEGSDVFSWLDDSDSCQWALTCLLFSRLSFSFTQVSYLSLSFLLCVCSQWCTVQRSGWWEFIAYSVRVCMRPVNGFCVRLSPCKRMCTRLHAQRCHWAV